MKLSYIIPTLGISPVLDECLMAINKTTKIDYEVLLINNGENPDFKSKINLPQIQTLFLNEKYHLGKAYNIGIKQATGDWIIFLHDDCILLEKEWYNRPIMIMELDKSIGLIVGSAFYLEEKNKQYYQTLQEVDWGQFLPGIIKRENSPLFDESYIIGHEDTDFCFQIHQLNKKVLYYPVGNLHVGGASTELAKKDLKFREIWENGHKYRTKNFLNKHKNLFSKEYILQLEKEIL